MLIAILAALTAAATPAALSDPLAPARAGKLECHSPDAARKRCAVLIGYRFGDDGVIANRTEALLSVEPWINMKLNASVAVQDGEVCGPFEGADKAEVLMNGQPADAAVTAEVRKTMQTFFDTFKGKQRCTAYERDGAGYKTTVTAKGAVHPMESQPMIWVEPGDGWTVKP